MNAPSPKPPASKHRGLLLLVGLLCLVGAGYGISVVEQAHRQQEEQNRRNAQALELAAQQQRQQEEAAEQAAAQKKKLEGLWIESAEYDYTADNKARYHQKRSVSVQLSADGNRYRGVWHQASVENPGPATYVFDGTFTLSVFEDQVTGSAESAHKQENGGAPRNLTGVSFSGAISDSGLTYKVVWQKDAAGKDFEWDTGTLKRQ